MAQGRGKKVAVALSGGVDSSVAAALLLKQGYEVIGITMRLADEDLEDWGETRTCCGLGEVEDVRRVAHKLGFPHYVLDLREVFQRTVMENFVAEYCRGRTPNPCIRCNQFVKFDALLRRVRAMGLDYVATGHYARLGYDEQRGRYTLRRGVDAEKDQSYVLYPLTQEQMAHTLLPLGGLTKREVRAIAADLGLRTAGKPESQEICFIPDHNYPRFLAERAPETLRPGPIVTPEGKVLGEHAGIAFYTIGQRRRLGLSAPEPLYVVDIDPQRNMLVVDTRRGTYRQEMIVEEVNYVSLPPLTAPREAWVMVRYRATPQPAMLTPLGETCVHVRFHRPQRALTPGQAAVFYEGDLVLAGGTIAHVFPAESVS
ncbi:MAG TPA: tRNA 2-thiouridine(34) synthase MnmA [Armatimonadetes bacterium]|nr:tRNA 2-thiouridine(34) synthase MnmA [Armatimonadota bacterium]